MHRLIVSATFIFLSVILPVDLVNAGSEFESFCADLSGKTKTPVIQGQDGWLFLTSEIKFLSSGKFWGKEAQAVSSASKPELRDPLPAIVDFNEQLKTAGLRLLIVPVPAKASIYPEFLPEYHLSKNPERRLDNLSDFLAVLNSEGVETLDLRPVFQAEKKTHSQDLLFCRTDTHWSPRGALIAAKAVAEKISAAELSGDELKERWQNPLDITGDLFQLQSGHDDKSESVDLFYAESAGLSPDSDILILADSHALVFQSGGDMFAENNGFPAYLSEFLGGRSVDLMAARGSAATALRINLARKIKSEPGWLGNKKIVIWLFASREFTDSQGWRKIPLNGL